jgi:tRNA threonylcarbamoyladenosine biosynthesis protein TsaE
MTDNAPFLTITVTDETQTGALAAKLGTYLSLQDVVSLDGTLGAGKSAFARALIRSLCGASTEVPSPTFNLLLTYDSPKGPIFHYDFYRLEDPEEAWELDIEQAYEEAITVMEWVSHLEDLAPENPLTIRISLDEAGSETSREFAFFGDESWQVKLQGLKNS